MRLHITEHALLRYLQRVRKFDFRQEVKEIENICHGVTTGTVKKHGCLFEVVDGSVITITPDTGHPNKTKRLKVTKTGENDEP
jgi:hypothetical protein